MLVELVPIIHTKFAVASELDFLRVLLLDLGEVFCKIKRQSAIKLLVLYPRKLLKIKP